MDEGDMDELDLFQQDAPAAQEMTSSGRPRRATREASRYPRELSSKSTAKASGEAGASSSSRKPESIGTRTRGARQKKPTLSKRKADGDEEESDDGGVEIVEVPPMSSPSRASGSGRAKAKAKGDDGGIDVDSLLTSPKSPLVGMEISDILNAQVWFSLSEDARQRLEELLPETAFGSHVPRVEECHPSFRQNDLALASTSTSTHKSVAEDAMEDVQETRASRSVLDISIFTDPHFESAARTFQDHLYTGWYSRPHRELVQKHLDNVRSGKQHAPWKDDVWAQNHDTPDEDLENAPADSSSSPKGKGRGIRANAFEPLIKHGLLAVGDVLSFSKTFTIHGVHVEKDALVYSIHPKTHAVTVVTCFGTRRSLPGQLLVPAADISTSPVDIREITVDSPMQLERALLDVDGRVPRPDHSHNALKCISMWRWPASSAEVYTEPEMMQCISEGQLDRGGRELYGTLFYLRGTTNGE